MRKEGRKGDHLEEDVAKGDATVEMGLEGVEEGKVPVADEFEVGEDLVEVLNGNDIGLFERGKISMDHNVQRLHMRSF